MDLFGLFYRPSQKDVITGGNTWLRRYFGIISIAAANANLQEEDSTGIVPADTVRLIRQVMFFWTPGAAQVARSAVLWSADANAAIQGVVAGSNIVGAGGTAIRHRMTHSGLEFPIYATERLWLAAEFDAGANVNSIEAYITGWEFPRGSLQR